MNDNDFLKLTQDAATFPVAKLQRATNVQCKKGLLVAPSKEKKHRISAMASPTKTYQTIKNPFSSLSIPPPSALWTVECQEASGLADLLAAYQEDRS